MDDDGDEWIKWIKWMIVVGSNKVVGRVGRFINISLIVSI